VNCIEPGSVRAEDLLAYLDGEAPPRVADHLGVCASCTATAAGYARAESRLRRGLRRFECPSPQSLGDYELDLVPAEERRQIAAHVVECPRCAEEMQTLRSFLAAGLAPPAPAETPVARLRRVVAQLVLPGPTTAYAGLRGMGDAATQTYRADELTITLDTTYTAPLKRANLLGLVWQETGAPATLPGAPIRLVDRRERVWSTQLDELGNFAFSGIPPGRYRLEVELDDQLVTIDAVYLSD
jgi:anti-sigma factor RsiW